MNVLESFFAFPTAQFDKLKKESEDVKGKLDSAVAHKDAIFSTLNKADQLELQGTIQGLLDGFNRITCGVEDRKKTLKSYVDQQREVAAKVEESVEFLNKIQEDVRALNKPIGLKPEDTQNMLNSYEQLLAELRTYREKMDDLQHRTSGNSGDLAAIVKQQDDLIAAIEAQIKKLRQLLLLRQQFMAIVAEITTFIAKYNEVVQDIEKGGKTVQEKIRRYDDVSPLVAC